MSNGSGFVGNVYPVRFAHPGKCDVIIYIKLKLKVPNRIRKVGR